MSKAFDKVWHEGLIFNLRQVGIVWEAQALINNFLNNRFHCVILYGQSSNGIPVKAGVPQGSTLVPLFYYYDRFNGKYYLHSQTHCR